MIAGGGDTERPVHRGRGSIVRDESLH